VFAKLDSCGTANTGIAAGNQYDFSCKLTHKILIELIDYHVTVMFGEETVCFSFLNSRRSPCLLGLLKLLRQGLCQLVDIQKSP
jgi:hypothetical protein